jgi:hypothetical protein
MTNGTCWESAEDDDDYGMDFACIMDPRFSGMLLGISSLLPLDSIPPFPAFGNLSQHTRDTRKLLKNHPIERLMNDDEFDVVFDGVCNMDWECLRNIGNKWMRVWYSARTIQRAYRERLKYRRMKMIQMVIVPIIVRHTS